VHHKFVVCGFKEPDSAVYRGSSNLASGGQENNGDNLLTIRDPDVVTAFTIEALSLVDHFTSGQMRNRRHGIHVRDEEKCLGAIGIRHPVPRRGQLASFGHRQMG
jgi:hypothetical protein